MRADIYWIDDLPRGRLAIVGRPRAGDWLADEISGWTVAGLSDVVSLLENDEVRELALEQEAALSMKAGLSFERFPIPDRGVPVSADAAAQLFDRIASKIANGRSVGVHCRAGILAFRVGHSWRVATTRNIGKRRMAAGFSRTRVTRTGHRRAACVAEQYGSSTPNCMMVAPSRSKSPRKNRERVGRIRRHHGQCATRKRSSVHFLREIGGSPLDPRPRLDVDPY
jgi:hypothetical protein